MIAAASDKPNATKVGKHMLSAGLRHPCYNEDAHHFFARMHVPVAPACNIRCKYCNRKYDCVSESRPGVVSKVLKPEEAVRKVIRVAGRIPSLSVVGVAGPGDPLANEQATFQTFRLIAEEFPDIQLCLSTNGLLLPDFADEIASLGVNHVTVTLNAIDPAIGSRIYDWIVYQGQIYRGEEAAKLLVEKQLLGIKMMAERGILCKINSVLIPGVNSDHLVEVSKAVKELGAFTHNIMPLIISPDSTFEQEGKRAPTPDELLEAVDKSTQILPVMRHCRQCRADAVGLIGEDLSTDSETLENEQQSYSLEERINILNNLEAKMIEKKQNRLNRIESFAGNSDTDSPLRIAVASRGGGRINRHFGHAQEFLIYEVSGNSTKLLGVRKVQAYCVGKADCRDKSSILQEIVEMLKDCSLLLSSGIGEGPKRHLQTAGIIPLVSNGDIEEQLLESAKYYRFFHSNYQGK